MLRSLASSLLIRKHFVYKQLRTRLERSGRYHSYLTSQIIRSSDYSTRKMLSPLRMANELECAILDIRIFWTTDKHRLVSVSKILTHTRFLLTLRSAEGSYRSLLLFRLSTGNDKPITTGIAEIDNQDAITKAISDQLYVMESACPHLGADMSHADIEEAESGFVAVCPWHRWVRDYISPNFVLMYVYTDTTLICALGRARRVWKLARTKSISGRLVPEMSRSRYGSSSRTRGRIGE